MMDFVTNLRIVDKFMLPENLKCSPAVMLDLKEAVQCFNVNASRAAAVMVRLALERSCDELGAVGNNLAVKIENLAARGIFDKDLVHGATAMRLFGNAAAHAGASLFDERGERVEYSLKMAVDLLSTARR